MRVAAAVGLALGALGGVAPPAPATEPPRLPPLDAAATPGLLAGPVRDRVLRTALTPRAAGVRRGAGQAYRTKDGNRLRVVVNGYRSTRADVQTFVDFLGDDVLHGDELSRLTLVIETPAAIAQDCSREAAACYTIPNQVLRVPGEEDQNADLPLAFVLTHEYGHHIAWNRSNAPFPAIDFGPKRWATTERVCPRWGAGQVFPGDEGTHYLANPGEAWAEAFAVWHYRSAPWIFSPLLRPDPRSLRAVRDDVRHPWRRLRTRRLSLGLGARPTARATLPAPLDGVAAVRVRTTGGLRVRTRVLERGRLLAPTRRTSLRSITICGIRALQLRVTRVSGRGSAHVSFSTP